MTTMIVHEPGGERAFVVPLAGPPPRGPFKTGTAELALAFSPAGRPTAATIRYRPTAFEFQAWLPQLIEIFSLPYTVFELGAGLNGGRPVVEFAARPEVLARIPAGIQDLAGMRTFMETGPALFELAEYGFGSIDFESGVAAGQ